MTADPFAHLDELEEKAGVKFKDISHLHLALTHSSFARQNKKDCIGDNERLEFLGDAVLKLVATDYLFEKFPTHREGDLTKMRS
ncbi:MAG: dsRNA-specific ribonuclease, partial [Candidatus Marinamargulisbacteria bacterium]